MNASPRCSHISATAWGPEFVGIGLEERVHVSELVARTLLDHPQADGHRDPVDPRRHRRTRLEAIDAAPRTQHRLLQCVVRVGHRAEQPVAVPVPRGPVWRRQLHEGLLVAVPRGGDDLRLRVTQLAPDRRAPTTARRGSFPVHRRAR
jgi:hypothetical protein